MYVSYLLEKESPSIAAQNFVGAPQYPDYGAYHVPAGIGLDNAQSPGSPWTAAYGAPLRDEWNGYGQAGGPGTAPAAAAALHGPSPAALAYSPAGDYLPHPHHPSQGPPAPPCGVPPSAGLMQPLNPPLGSDPLSPGGQRRNFCDWMRKPTAGGPGKAERAGRLCVCVCVCVCHSDERPFVFIALRGVRELRPAIVPCKVFHTGLGITPTEIELLLLIPRGQIPVGGLSFTGSAASQRGECKVRSFCNFFCRPCSLGYTRGLQPWQLSAWWTSISRILGVEVLQAESCQGWRPLGYTI
uniref:Caudal-like activation domain-containing protein n=1 Tax=Pseudonaja textilis TaxID=8673 RepID=A0A670ZFR3_PSETE